MRTGLARLLADPKYRAFQIDHFARGKIESSQRLLDQPTKAARRRGAKPYGPVLRQFSLAALASVGNSAGPGVATAWFQGGLREANGIGVGRENTAVIYMLRRYVQKANKKRELDKYPDGETFLNAAIVDPNAALANKNWRLGHHGGRVRKLFEVFPFFAFDPVPSDISQDDIEKPPAQLELFVPPKSEISDDEPAPGS